MRRFRSSVDNILSTNSRSKSSIRTSRCPDTCGLPAHQLRELNEIAAGVVQPGDLGAGHVRWWHDDFRAARFHTLASGHHVVSEEHGRGLALLEHRLVVSFGRRVVVEGQLQFRALRFLGRDHREPAKRSLAEVR